MEGLLQPTHLILILGIALLLFGPRRLPELGQGLGKGIRGFRDGSVEKHQHQQRRLRQPSLQTHPQPSHARSAVPTIPSRQSSCAEWGAQNSAWKKSESLRHSPLGLVQI